VPSYKDLPYEHHQIYLLLDRTLSPAAARLFKDQRILNDQHGWPHPGVFTIPELAGLLLRDYEKLQQKKLFPDQTLSPLNFVKLFTKKGDNPWIVCKDLQKINKIRALGLSLSEWKELLNEYESQNKDPEWRDWTRRILLYLESCGHCLNNSLWENKWSPVETTLELFKEFKPNWTSITKRNPTLLKEKLEIIIPTYQEPYPLEEYFIAQLKDHLNVTLLTPETSEEGCSQS